MSEISNQNYLLNDQYKNANNLNARVMLHARFSTNTYGWHRWIFDHFKLPQGARVLELGIGPGYLWQSNRDRIPEDWQITLSDFSPGMLEEANNNLAWGKVFDFQLIDAQSIPYEDALFDAVIANHMLYHVPDRPKALAEIRRVLKPGGRFYASTVGEQHMVEIEDLIWQTFQVRVSFGQQTVKVFSLENGAQQLSAFFSNVTLSHYENTLLVTEAEPLFAYMLSGRSKALLDKQKQQQIRQLLEREIAEQGVFRITTASGLFEAY